MVLLKEEKKFSDPEECPVRLEEQSLMSKYKIPVNHFEYSYIETCKDGREMEKIVQVLRSGQEGYFPDLTRFAEERLAVIKPKSKLLRKVCPVVTKEALSKDERNELTEDLTQWVSNVSKEDDELVTYKNRKAGRTVPDVREVQEKVVEEKKAPPKRISATDYSSWDKYDPDTEILKMDLEEENLKKSQKEKKKPIKKTVQFKEHTTEIEALHEANYEKDKGNEFFRAGDYNEALRHYTNSINCKPTLASYTNRALVHIKLKNYKNSLDDCHSALAIEPNNVKALVRKTQALNGLGRLNEALECIEHAVEMDPNNTLVQDIANRLRTECGVILKNTRFKVEDVQRVEQNVQRVEQKVQRVEQKVQRVRQEPPRTQLIIPIPGTSKMLPPYYITCTGRSGYNAKQETIRANTPSQIVHLISVDNTDVDDDDSCTVNHLKSICSNSAIAKDYSKDCNENITSLNDRISNVQVENISKKNDKQVVKDNKNAGGEPYVKDNDGIDMPDDIHSPYSFIKAWNSANVDPTFEQHASILKSLDISRIVGVIGCKMDNAMFSTILRCLSSHFAVPGEVERLHLIMENIVRLPRFEIVALLMSPADRSYVNTLLNFLNQHGKCVSHNVMNKLFSH